MTAPARERAQLDETATLWLQAYTETKAEIARLEEQATQARRHIEEALGDAEEGVLDGQIVVRWTFVTSNRVDLKKLEAEHPDLVEAFRKPSSSRRFTIADGE